MEIKYCKYCFSTLNELHCNNCQITFKENDALLIKKSKYPSINLECDPNFYQYTDTKELLKKTTIELTNLLGISRKEYRRLSEIVYKGKLAGTLDYFYKINYDGVKTTICVIENILIERTGIYPTKVFPQKVLKDYENILLKQRQKKSL